jgi:hypothetical protein
LPRIIRPPSRFQPDNIAAQGNRVKESVTNR